MRARFVRALIVVPLLGSCVYLNGLYNSRRYYRAAESSRRAGHAAESERDYARAIEIAAESFRADPDGRWADDALYVVGRAHLRRGDLALARSALEEARLTADDDEVRLGATLYLGAVAALEGRRGVALRLLNDALRALGPGELRGEGHLWRARLHLAAGDVDVGWWDLERAVEDHERHRVPTSVEQLVWGVAHDDPVWARRGAEGLLSHRDGAARLDTIRALVRSAAGRWGLSAAARLLEDVERSPWPREQRDPAIMLRASLRAEAGDTAGARRDAERVMEAAGPGAVGARLWLAGQMLAGVEDVDRLDGTRALLLPAVDDSAAMRLVRAIREVDLLVERAREEGDAFALFAAGEKARDDLAAPRLARGLFERFVNAEPSGPWAAKALLAAVALEPDPRARERLQERVLLRAESPYVRTLGGEPDPRLPDLELRLREALAIAREAASRQADLMDVEARARRGGGG